MDPCLFRILHLLSRLFGYDAPGFVASDTAAMKDFCRKFTEFVTTTRFRQAESRLGWESAQDGAALEKLPFLKMPDRPDISHPSGAFEWLIELLK